MLAPPRPRRPGPTFVRPVPAAASKSLPLEMSEFAATVMVRLPLRKRDVAAGVRVMLPTEPA